MKNLACPMHSSPSILRFRPHRSLGMWLLLMVPSLLTASQPADSNSSELTHEAITIQSQTFTNAIVFNRSADLVILSHQGGLISFRVDQLDADSRRALGLPIDNPDPAVNHLGFWEPLMGLRLLIYDLLGLESNRWYGLAGLALFVCVAAGLFLYTSYLFWVICMRTETQPGIAVWLPFLQLIPLLQAARLPGAWALGLVLVSALAACSQFAWPQHAMLCGTVSVCACVVLWGMWSVRICQARGKGLWLALLLFVPGINYAGLVYLAASK